MKSILVELNQRKRVMLTLLLLGLIIFYISTILHKYTTHWPYLLIPVVAWAFIVVATIGFATGLRCPRCRKSLSKEAQKGSLFSFPKTVKRCPFCGISLEGTDTSMTQEKKRGKGKKGKGKKGSDLHI